MSHSNPLLRHFPVDPSEIPTIMPSPFSSDPHPLAEQACRILQQCLPTTCEQGSDDDSAAVGKMFGVLLVRESSGAVGFLSAFSGMMNGAWQLPGFVPPMFDPAEQDSFLPAGYDELAQFTQKLQQLEDAMQQSGLAQKITHMQQQRDQAVATLKQQHKIAKAQRKQQRLALQQPSRCAEYKTEMAALALASQHHKREAINCSAHWHEKIQLLQQQLEALEQQIKQIKEARAQKSRGLHLQVFASYQLRNNLGEQQGISHFFEGMPPAGSGDCAGPKLLHYAHQHQLQPLALAEFWWGASPSTGIRHHGHFYPACRGKCLPILPFMLRGLAVEDEPDYAQVVDASEPRLVYEDDSILLINKPAGLMSAPGKSLKDSVITRLRLRYPDCPSLKLIHRLDMATSGLLLLAKTVQANKFLQKQFIQRNVEKRYEALISRRLPLEPNQGDIDLPLHLDIDDRPRQLVCHQHGKSAQTHWQLIKHEGETSRVYFYPRTGRTHQLRVHAAHRDGLNAAIVGDALYGTSAQRLMLHAQYLRFKHPLSRQYMEFELPAPF